MLLVKKIKKSYSSKRVLNGVDLGLKPHEIRAFLGPNGAGKTTTFNIIAGVEFPTGGKIYLDGEDISGLPVHVRAQRGLSYLPQETSLFRGLSVRDNIRIYLRKQGITGKDLRKQEGRILEHLDLGKLENRRTTTLSAGQKRKVEIGRSLALSPRYSLLDEPFSDLDPKSVEDLKGILVALKKGEEIGIALSDHRAREAISISDYNYLIEDGSIISEGDSNQIVKSERARKSYLGETFDLSV